MININVYGVGSNTDLKKLIKSAASSYLKALLPRKRKVNIKIEVVTGLESSEGVFGECYEYNSDEYYKYVIRLDNNSSTQTLLVTLAHEFIHLKQYDRKELRFYTKDFDSARWKGQLYENYDYDTAPWEVEANDRELALYNDFINQDGL
jgi:hypothetical protein